MSSTSEPLVSDSLAADEVKQVFGKRVGLPRKSLFVRNLSGDSIYLIRTKSKTAPHLTVKGNGSLSFPPHLFAMSIINGDVHSVIHCEWTEEVWLHNPSGNVVNYEALEVF